MIQSVMLAAMGFIAASLLALSPAFWARAVRLTNQRLRGALPVSEQEIRADKDLLRAEYALKVHQLERELEQGRLAAHRQKIEINRRDIQIRQLSEGLETSQASLGEHRNARSVLEQTVTERIPLLERSLAEARDLLESRDAAIGDLQATADRQAGALEDGRAILTQRALEVQRLQALFQEASAHGRDSRADAGGDSLALRAEIESLKARLAERAAVIDRLQGEAAARPRAASMIGAASSLPEDAGPAQLRALISEQAAEIGQLRRDLSSRPRTGDASAIPVGDRELAARHLQELETQLRAQTGEIDRLRAESEAVASASDPIVNARVHDSKIWLRTRINRIESQLEHERETTGRLRAELAAANERMARQAAQFRDEYKRQAGRAVVPARDILRDVAKPAADTAIRLVVPPEVATAARRPSISSRARELQRALQGQFGRGQAAAEPAQQAISAAANDTAAAPPVVSTDAAPEAADDTASRGRLLDRLKSYEQA